MSIAITKFDVFLSHSHDDAPVVEQLGVKLEDVAQCSVWLDKWLLVPGGHWQQAMAKALDEAGTCAVCVGASTPLGWFQEEIEVSLSRQARDSSFRVIPVILPGGDPSVVRDFLALRTWVDFSADLNDQIAFHNLVCGIRGVAPGRPDKLTLVDSKVYDSVRTRLRLLRDLRVQVLIDDEVAVEMQKRILEPLIVIGDLS